MRRLAFMTLLLITACGNSAPNTPPANSPPAANQEHVKPPEDSKRKEARRLFDEAEALSVAGDNSAAADKLERAIALSPTDGEIHARLGHVYIKLLRYDDARGALLLAIKLVEGEPRRQLEFLASWCSYTHATELFQGQQHDKALNELRTALELQPDNTDARRLVGQIHSANGRYDEATRAYAILCAQTTGDVHHSALRDMGEAQFRDGKYRAAIETFTKLIDLNAEGYEAYGWRGYCHVQVGDRQRAVSDFTQAVQRTSSPERRADYDEKLRQLAQVDEGE
ncbi:MAG: tetratricopeptide repeat protein [Planctomycetes bacterium]|nr:tetratricopeptide repeat protein [Planctomycetota bacterium]